MGLLEPHVRHGGRCRESRLNNQPKAITAHSLRHARAVALASSRHKLPALLLSAPAAAAFAGPGWFGGIVDAAQTGEPGAELIAALDCGSMPGHALAALRRGLPVIRYDGPAFDAIATIARKHDTSVLRARPKSLDLGSVDPSNDADLDLLAEKCGDWLNAKA